MSWLDNPLANMYGPHFLLLYAAVAVVGLAALWFLPRRDATSGEPAPPVPSEPDPYAVAYLRGGLHEVSRVAVVELLQRRYLTSRKGVFKKGKKAPSLRYLEGIPRVAYDWFKAKRKRSVREVFDPMGVPTALREQVEPALRQPLEADRLLATAQTRRRRRWLTALAAVLLLVLGVYKLTVALTKGYTNVLFLVLLLVVSLAVSVVIVVKLPRTTARGRKYLDGLSLAFRQLEKSSGTASKSACLPLLVGLFGSSALSGTSYAFHTGELEQLRHTAQSNDGIFSTSCGSSCGGGGGGCGGGCGGCGA